MRARTVIGFLAASTLTASVLVMPASTATAETAPRPLVFGWFGWWASDAAISQLTANSEGVVDEVAMFWWSFQGERNPLCLYDNGDYDKDGNWGDPLCRSATPWTTPKFDRQRKMLQAAGIKVQASITDLGATSKGKLSAYLSEEENRRAYAEQIADYAARAEVDGIDLDWEVFAFHDGRPSWPDTRKYWIETVKLLYAELRDRGLTLSVTVPGGQVYWGGSSGVYALKEIIDHTDRVRFMTYDYSWGSPGPISPTSWAKAQLQAAISEVGQGNARKLWLGNPQYGREWALNRGTSTSPVYGTDAKCPAGWSPGYYRADGTWISTVMRTIGTPGAALAAAQSSGVEPQWNSTQGEWTFRYAPRVNGRYSKDGTFVETQCRVDREVWFGDTRSALLAASRVPELNIAGIAVWNLGNVMSDFYPRLAEYGREIAPSPTQVSVRAPKMVVAGAQARIRVTTDSRKGPAAGAEATLYFAAASGTPGRTKVGAITLDDKGAGAFRVPVNGPGEWTVEVAGSSTRQGATSAPVTIAVRFAVAATASTTTPKVSTPVTLSATVSPAQAGVVVTLQRQGADGTWGALRTLTTDAAGAVTASVRPTMVKKVSYRFVASATDQFGMGRSSVIALDVQP